jgi:hypothetical protein
MPLSGIMNSHGRGPTRVNSVTQRNLTTAVRQSAGMRKVESDHPKTVDSSIPLARTRQKRQQRRESRVYNGIRKGAGIEELRDG